MTQKTNSRKSEAAGETRAHLRDAAHTARQNFEHATRAGERIQEQAGTWLRSMMSGADLQRYADSYVQLTSNTVPLAQRGMRQLMELMETNSRTSVDLMKKATDAFQAPSLKRTDGMTYHSVV